MDVLSALLLKLIKNKIKIAKVVVRIPPPTELGEDPINIKIPMIILVGHLVLSHQLFEDRTSCSR